MSSMWGGSGRSIIERGGGPRLWAARPIFPSRRPILSLPAVTTIPRVPPRLRLLGVLLACASPWRAPPRRRRAATRRSASKLARALRAPGVSALVGSSRSSSRPAGSCSRTIRRLPLIPASNEKLAVTYAALVSLGPVYRIETQVLGSGRAGRTEWHGDLVLKGFGDPTLSSLGVRRLAAEVRSVGHHGSSQGGSSDDESYFDSFRIAPGWKPHFFINESPPLSALTVDRGRYLGRTSRTPALAAALLFRKALAEAGVRVVGPAKVGAAPAEEQIFPVGRAAVPTAVEHPQVHGPRERQLHGRDPAQAARHARVRAGDDGRGRARSSAASWPSTNSRWRAFGSPTARGSRA